MNKYLLSVAIGGLLCAGSLSAAPIFTTQPSCLSFGTGSATDTSVTFAVFTTANFACQQEDKIYSNFAISGAPTSSTLRFQLQVLGPVDFHVVTLNGNFVDPLSFSYDIAIDQNFGGPGANSSERITRVTGDISNPSGTGLPFNTKTVAASLTPAVILGTLVSTTAFGGGTINVSETALHVTDTYVPLGGAVVSISNTFVQVGTPNSVPEPLSYTLFGGGLILVGALRRFRR